MATVALFVMSSSPGSLTSSDPDAAMSTQLDSQGKAWGVAFSGGGWRALGASIGLAKSLHGAGIFDQLDAVSSVSGGSW